MTASPAPKVALLYPGDRVARDRADPAASRFAALFDAFAAAGVDAQPAVWHDDFVDEVRAQLLGMQAVLVWCNPIEEGRRRDRLDALLRDVAMTGVFVSAHPDAIQCLGTKDVLFETRDLPFGTDVHRIDSPTQLAAELPQRLRHGARVLKQRRGHSGIGVWRVEQSGDGLLTVQHAQRGTPLLRMDWPTLQVTLAPYFEPDCGGHLIDQAWQPRLVEGMVRAYLVEDRVTGFGLQAKNGVAYKTFTYVGLVAVFSIMAGLIYGAWVDGVNPAWIALGLAAFVGSLVALLGWLLGRRRAPAHA